MKKKYIKPQTVNYGKSEELIQGGCGFGVEIWQLTDANARMQTVKRIKRVACNPYVHPGQIMCDFCETVTICTSDSSRHC